MICVYSRDGEALRGDWSMWAPKVEEEVWGLMTNTKGL